MSLFKNQYRIESARKPDWDYGSNGAYFITICTQNRTHFFGEIKDHQMYVSNAGLLAQQYWMEIPQRFPYAFLDAFIVMPNHIHGIIIINKHESEFDDVETRFIASNAANAAPESPNPTPDPQSPNKIAGGVTGDHNPMFHENISRILRWYKGRCTFEIRRDAIHRVSIAQNVIDNTQNSIFQQNVAVGGTLATLDAINRVSIAQNVIDNTQNSVFQQNVAVGGTLATLDAINRVSTAVTMPKFDWQERFHDHIIRNHASYLHIQNYILTNPQRWKDDKFNT